VLVSKVKPVQKTASGIHIPESAQPQLNQGVVVAVGAGARDKAGTLIPVSVKVGEKVLLPDFGGTNVKFGEKEEYSLYRDEELLGVLHE